MTRTLAPIVPPALRAILDSDPGDPAIDGFTLVLLTHTTDGWPHATMLSAGEVVPDGDAGLRLALWSSSTVTRNLGATPRAALTAIVAGVAYTLRLETQPDGTLELDGLRPLTCIAARVVAALGDEAPYAVLDSGIRFRLRDPGETHRRWRLVRASLRSRATE